MLGYTKIRPWFGHDSHFHVRIACPKDAAYCEDQAPVPAGDGCGDELYSWFEPANQVQALLTKSDTTRTVFYAASVKFAK